MKSLLELNRRDPAFRDRRPDPYRAPEPPGPIEAGFERALPWIFAAAGGLALGAVVLLLVVVGYDLRMPFVTPGDEQRFIHRLEMAARNYELDYGALPPADRVGSASLATALATLSPSGQLHLFVEPGMLDAQGNLLTPSGRPVHYRPGISVTRWGFALWADDGPDNFRR